MRECAPPTFQDKAFRALQAKTVVGMSLAEAYASHNDKGVQIVFDGRRNLVSVICVSPFKKGELMLVPFTTSLKTVESKSQKCSSTEVLIGKVQGATYMKVELGKVGIQALTKMDQELVATPT